MAEVINTNIASLNSQRNLTTSQASLATSLQRLSSGLRINSAKDDAAGLAISQRFQSQINGDTQAARNANDGISLAQTAEGGLSTASDLLQRIRTLAVQSANGTNSDSDRKSIQNEVSSLTAELNRVATTTQFNGQNVLDGSLTSTQFQVGANANQTISVGISSAKSSDLGNNTLETTDNTAAGSSQVGATAGANNVAAQTLTISSGAGISTSVSVAAGASAATVAASVNSFTASSGVSAQATSEATISGITAGPVQFQLTGQNGTAVTISAAVPTGGSLSALAQAVNAQSGTTNVTASVQLNASGVSELKLSDNNGDDIKVGNLSSAATGGLVGATIRGANNSTTGAASTNTQAFAAAAVAGTADTSYVVGGHVSFSSDSGFSITSDDTTGSLVDATGSQGSNLQEVANIDVSTTDGANASLRTIDSALNQINSNRAALGAIQNRFTSTVSNLQTTTENLSASQSRIQDTDFAAETANLTRGQILQQAGTAILAQANSLPNGVLALLR